MILYDRNKKLLLKKKELTNDSAEELSYKFNQLKLGQIVTVIYFCIDEYVKCSCMVSKIDPNERSLSIVKNKINLENIISIYGHDIKELDE